MGILIGANCKGRGDSDLHEDEMLGLTARLDKACEGESNVMADFVLSTTNLVNSDRQRLAQEPVWGEERRAGGQDQKICLDMLINRCLLDSI